MFRFTRHVAILKIGDERLVYLRDRNADIEEIERELRDIIFDDVQFFDARQEIGK